MFVNQLCYLADVVVRGSAWRATCTGTCAATHRGGAGRAEGDPRSTSAPYSGPGAPWQNGILESFNGRLRDELLPSEIFDTLSEVRYLIDRWRLF
jgi:transposase InsO family protein